MFFACGIWCLADVSSISPSSEQSAKHHIPQSVCSDKALTLETSAKHHIPQAKNIPYQPLLIKPIFSVLAHAEKQFFSKLVFPVSTVLSTVCIQLLTCVVRGTPCLKVAKQTVV